MQRMLLRKHTYILYGIYACIDTYLCSQKKYILIYVLIVKILHMGTINANSGGVTSYEEYRGDWREIGEKGTW